ncbi:nuclear transport factor 2 family protein [Robertkochia aurantiaca]|uniref:nuclear transport factor 2 family protein n=1 Tax=Robertkochia aurantiaca TaxID=2873700 RepID=UPI001CCE8193|nr:nuclear transport factor 2 family protein [Robertkochia sp. 3YJGBD-33]
MSSENKNIVKRFYDADNLKKPEVLQSLLHDDCQLFWNSSKGFLNLGRTELLEMAERLNASYHSIRAEISHIIAEGNEVSLRFTYYVTPIEDPEEETALAHFITIWEIKDEKLYRGYEISQLADDHPVNLNSFLRFNLESNE